MDCEYVLVCRIGIREGDKFYQQFHAPTPEEAVERAREIIKIHQEENVHRLPFSPVVVKGELYRQIQELDGSDFIVKVENVRTSNPTLVDRHMTP